MNTTRSFLAAWSLVAAGIACAAADALPLHEQAIASASSGALRSAYLECDRLTAQHVMGEGFMLYCEQVARVLQERDFGGSLERQLQWWRTARAAMLAEHEAALEPRDALQ